MKALMTLLIGVAVIAFVASPTYAIHPNCELDVVGDRNNDGEVNLEDQIECAIEEGLEWLIGQQNPVTGDFDYSPVATTGLACLKLADRGKELAKDNPDIEGPFDPDYEYSDELQKALDYIFGRANVSGDMIYFQDSGLYVYSTGIAAMCIAATEAPDRVVDVGSLIGMTYQQVLQKIVNWLVFAQNNGGCEIGGWGYSANQVDWADNSNSGYASLGLGFAQSFFGIDISAVLPGLDIFIDNIQDTTGGVYDGGSEYNPCYPPGNEYRNTLKAGNLLYELGLVGEGAGDDRVDRSVDFIERYWNTFAGVCDGCGWKGDYQAMFAMLKGLESLGIDELDIGGGPFDWFEVVATYIVNNQNSDGSWLHTYGEGTPAVIDTTWALLTLEKAVPEITKRVSVDIKPGSCPNPINQKSKGVLPIAILGTEEFDVTTIDPATVRLTREGIEDAEVAPLRWSLEDVGTPFEGELCDCHDYNGDGYMDLTLKFSTPDVVEVLKLVDVAGETLPLTITGNLMEDYNGTPIKGEDCVRVLDVVKK